MIIQFIGLFVINQYSPVTQNIVNPQNGTSQNITFYPAENQLPFGMQPPQNQANQSLLSIIISFAIAFLFIFLLMKYRVRAVIKIWFLLVVILALGVSFNAFFKIYFMNAWILSIVFAVPLGLLKVFRPNYIIHNFTELFIYPGIAAIFVPVLGVLSVIIVLILISIYDMWAVWHSKVMIKMAKFQMNEVGVFGGLFIPNLTKKIRGQIAKLRKSKSKKGAKRIKISMAILGGGDIAFPLIAAGVFLRAYGIIPALFVIFGALAGLGYLLARSEKKKFYPAMPFITVGIFIALIVWKVLF